MNTQVETVESIKARINRYAVLPDEKVGDGEDAPSVQEDLDRLQRILVALARR
jgi:hypothetical protein